MEHDVSTSRMADEFKEILARQKRAAKARLDAR
jgi:hypothetical protein